MADASTRRTVRSFVIRQGRMSDSQRTALTQRWQQYGIELSAGKFRAASHFHNTNPLTLEIGFGMGDSLLQAAFDDPQRNFLGIEVHKPGVGHLLREAHDRGLKNLKVYCEDSVEVLKHCISDACLDRVQILFPDPWPKKRHHKRRLINESLLHLVHDRLVDNGLLHIATDWQPYADEITKLVSQYKNFTAISAPERPETKYERRGVRLGHQITDLAYRKLPLVLIDQQ